MNNNITGLKLTDIYASLTQLEERTKEKINRHTTPLSLIIGIISGVALFVFSFYSPLLAIRVVGMFFGAPLLGFSAGQLTYALIDKFSRYKTNCIAKFHLDLRGDLNAKYNETDLPNSNDLKEVLKIADHEMQWELIRKMNVEQLLITYDFLGKQFHSVVGRALGDRVVFDICLLDTYKKDPKELIEVLKGERLTAAAKAQPLIAKYIYDKLKDVNDVSVQNLIKKYYSPPQKSDISLEKNAKALINGKIYHFNLGQIKKYSGTLRNVLTDTDIDINLHTNNVFQHFFQDYPDENIDLFFDLINEKHVTFDKQKLLNFVDLCDRFAFDIDTIEFYLQAHTWEFNDDELTYIVETLPDLKTIPNILKKRMEKKKHTDATWLLEWERAHALGNQVRKKECFNYARQRAISLVTSSDHEEAAQWLGICKQILDELLINTDINYAGFCNQLVNEVETSFRTDFYSIPYIFRTFAFSKRYCLDTLNNRCLDYCRTHSDALKNSLPWNFKDIPEEIAQILYPAHG